MGVVDGVKTNCVEMKKDKADLHVFLKEDRV